MNFLATLIWSFAISGIAIPKDKKGAPPFSIDDNLFHTSTEGKVLENPKNSAPEFIFQRSVSPEKAPNKPIFALGAKPFLLAETLKIVLLALITKKIIKIRNFI